MFIDLSIILPDLIALTEWILMVPNSNWSDKPISFYNQFYLVNCDVMNFVIDPSTTDKLSREMSQYI